MTTLITDVLIDVAPGIAIYRVNGTWQWKVHRDLTKDQVIKEIMHQIKRLTFKKDLLEEALASLQMDLSE